MRSPFFILVLILGLTACGPGSHTYTTTNQGMSLGAEKSLGERVQTEIFNNKCIGCHNELRAKGKVRLDNLEEAIKTINLAAPLASELLNQINIGEMPPPPIDPLTSGQVQLLKSWVLEVAAAASEAE